MTPASAGPSSEAVGPTASMPPTQPVPDGGRGDLRYMLSIYSSFRAGATRLLAASFLSAIGGGMSWFVLILYIYELFPHLTNVGLIFSISSWTIVVTLLPAGWMVDRFDHRRMLALSVFLGAAAMALFAAAVEVWMVVLGQVLNGIGQALSRPAFQALMTEKTSDRRRKYLFALQSMVSMIGVACASLLAGQFSSYAEKALAMDLETAFRTLFVLATLANLVAVLVAFTIRPGEEGRDDEEEQLPSLVPDEVDAVEARKRGFEFIVRFSTPMALIGLGAGFVVPYFQLYYILKFGVNVQQVAWLFTLTQISMGLSFFLVPNLAERRGSVSTVVVTQGVAVVNLALIPFAPVFIVATPFHLIRMALMNASTPIQNSLMMGAVRPVDRGRASAIGQFMWTITNSVGITFSGFIMDNYGLDTPFVIAVSLYTAAVALFWYWFRGVGEM